MIVATENNKCIKNKKKYYAYCEKISCENFNILTLDKYLLRNLFKFKCPSIQKHRMQVIKVIGWGGG